MCDRQDASVMNQVWHGVACAFPTRKVKGHETQEGMGDHGGKDCLVCLN
jgi:hypothetical protein